TLGRRDPHAPWAWAIEKMTGLKTQLRTLLTNTEPDGFTHTVKWPGENLSSISLWYTGSSKNWVRLIRANPGTHPRRIKIGDSIQIPKALLRTNRPLPYSFLSAETHRKILAPISANQAEVSGTRELYGPIGIDDQGIPDGDQVPPLPLETID
ncbi:MAG: hypothetical protein WBG37_07740, partial [Desulfobacterales bacterium]